MLLKFELNMPGRGSWNGGWTGEDTLYARVVGFRGKEREELAKKILSGENYFYNFGDGWCAQVNVEHIDSKEAAKVRRKSKGFCGYDWMIDSIVKTGEIRAPR